MTIPLSFHLKEAKLYFGLHTKLDKYDFMLKQVTILPFSFISGQLPISLGCHIAAAFSSLSVQPSKNRVKDLAKHYNIDYKKIPKTKFNWKALGIAAAVVGASFLRDYDSFILQKQYVETSEYALEPLSVLGLYVGMQTEIARSFYSLFKNLFSLSGTKTSLMKSFKPFFSEKEDGSKEGSYTQAKYLIKEHPEEGLAKTIELYYDNKISSSSFHSEIPAGLMLHVYGKNAISSFVNSVLGYGMEEYSESFFNKAKEEAIEKKDISTLSLLALYEYKEKNSTSIFEKQIELLFQDKKIRRELLAEGTFTNTYTCGYNKEKEPLRLTLVQKVSKDFSRLKEKKQLVEDIAIDYPEHVTKMLDLSFHDDVHVLTELRMRYPSLHDVVQKRPELLDEAYSLLGKLESVLDKERIVKLKNLNVEQKYSSSLLLETKAYCDSLVSAQELFSDVGDYQPLLDFHANNILVSPTNLIDIDIENKGRGPKMLDIINLLDYSHDVLTQSQLSFSKEKILSLYQEELNIDNPKFDLLYLHSLGLRRNSFLGVRKTKNGYVQSQEVNSFLTHCAGIFHKYTQNSSQKNLAKIQLELTEQLYKGT